MSLKNRSGFDNSSINTATKQLKQKRKKKGKKIKSDIVKHNFSDEFVMSNDFLNCYEWRKVRYSAIKKNKGRCECCGTSFKNNNSVYLCVDQVLNLESYFLS